MEEALTPPRMMAARIIIDRVVSFGLNIERFLNVCVKYVKQLAWQFEGFICNTRYLILNKMLTMLMLWLIGYIGTILL